MELTREQALALLRQYNEEPFHLRHALTVEAVKSQIRLERYGRRRRSGPWMLHDLTGALPGGASRQGA